ncbi:hypothetical protein BgAZ_500800 [Babesia gibsoni]|uniref:Uncharacterized protein n=1 Tax=Babesia gibsoni TaxID=33632 RepID=A0AAD8LI17_BABGI|nr:hypothetical protein BgAZ_500800 [Babesia gibsoni]
MEELLSLYRQTVAEDIKDTLKQANACTLQRMLYANSDTFGQLSKYDYFHKAFGVPPNPCECVSFLRFWQGVEKAFSFPEPMINGARSFELQKSLFVDDEHFNSMRHFRDQLLKHASPMPIASFLSIIDSCSYSSDGGAFWLRVRENSRRTFGNDSVNVDDISDMVLGHLSQRFTKTHKKTMHLPSMSTCVSINDNEPNPPTNGVPVMNIRSYRSIDSYAEDKYRKLLEMLDSSLPALYNKFCDRIEELTIQKDELEGKCMDTERALDELKTELSSARNSLQSRCQSLQENNTMLQRKMESKDHQLESYRQEVDTLKERASHLEASNREAELQGYMKKCASMEHTNGKLQRYIDSLERRIASISEAMSSRSDACVGTDVADAEAQDHVCPTWETSQEREGMLKEREGMLKEREGMLKEREGMLKEREGMLKEREDMRKELKRYKMDNMALNNKIYEFEEKMKSLSKDMNEAVKERHKVEESMKDHIPMHKYIAEKDRLKVRIASMELEITSLNGAINRLHDDCRALESDRSLLLSTKAHIEQELENYKTQNVSMETELDNLRKKCAKDEAESSVVSELQNKLEESNVSNSELRSRLDAMEKDKAVLMNRIEELEVAGQADEDVPEEASDASSNEEEDQKQTGRTSSSSLPGDNMIRISHALAETRRLSTLNAAMYGQIDMSEATRALSMSFDRQPSAQSATEGLLDRPLFSNRSSNTLDTKETREKGDSRQDSAVVASLSEESENDVFQSAAAYFSKRLNL